MGMTIDDCIKMLIAKGKCMERETSGIDTNCNLRNCDDCSLCYEQGTMGEQKEALKSAINIMRKYQKIRQIAFPLQFCTTDKLNHEAIMKICEVVEDGNDD